MTAPHTYITTTIPYVNARPHLGFALELVQADVLARHRRQQGERVGVQEFVDRNAAEFAAMAGDCPTFGREADNSKRRGARPAPDNHPRRGPGGGLPRRLDSPAR